MTTTTTTTDTTTTTLASLTAAAAVVRQAELALAATEACTDARWIAALAHERAEDAWIAAKQQARNVLGGRQAMPVIKAARAAARRA